ncbi:HAMP domain-containing histidine kinase [Clostridium sp. 'deep sea']|uniref:HAMP domain-containing sensor histidine kinase n=1 Tax=Clostridium sp. 'deep sea' TaxID=2779445 RepID=UPI0018969838|nr:HAMP domain-containing sensor histidine kinase [Clostridium sp. 'deep sea']QOR36571.1 HAMP domain-containing histidine kinase [Clostridium sp. 'deep sea']
MNSIRQKLFAQIGSIIIILIIVLILANTYLLPRYYLSREKNQLLDYYKKINDYQSTDYQAYLKDFVIIENQSNTDILVYSADGKVIYASKSQTLKYNTEKKNIPPKLNKDVVPPRPPLTVVKIESVNKQVSFMWAQDQRSHTRVLILTGLLDNGLGIDLTTSLLAIKTSTALANRFLLITGIPLFFIGLVSAYFLAKHFTKPIVLMNNATANMKNLNFNICCTINSNDEIGQLAQGINEMSVELASTIKSLNSSNKNLQKQIQEKIKIDKKRKELLNNVSHELKTPLALMQGYAEGLKLNIAKDQERADFYCDVIVDETKKMNYLVQNLLNINQLEFGDKALRKTEFEIVDLVDYCIKKFQQKISNKGIDVTFNGLYPIDVYADMLKVEQVLNNYISNAIYYVDERKILKIKMVDKNKHVRIEVYNTCSGIKEDELEKMWNSFYKRDEARTYREGSHGLGLSIVKAIMEADQNDYGVKLENEGITFWFEVSKVL